MTTVLRSDPATPQAGHRAVSLAVVLLLMAALLSVIAPAGAAAASQENGGSVTVMTRLCPDDWGDVGMGPVDLDVICDESVDRSAFITIRGDGFEASEKVAGRMAMFQGIPYGLIEIVHTAPRGYGNAAVFCADTFEGAGVEDRLEVADGTTVHWELDPNAEVWTTCHVYFMPADDDGATAAPSSEVALAAWSCPAGTDLQISTIGTCEEATADTSFAVAGGAMDVTWAVDRSDNAGTLVDLEPASYSIDAVPPATAAAVHWRCGALGVSYMQAPLADGASAALATEAGTDYRCDWFIVAAAGDPGEQPASIAAVVRVAAIACPDGIDPAAGFAALADACPALVDGRPDAVFEITDPGGSRWMKGSALNANGFEVFEFTEAPIGQVRVTLQPVDGYVETIVWCSDTGAADLGTGEPVSADGVVSVLRQPDATDALTCVFFLVPASPDATPVASPQATPA